MTFYERIISEISSEIRNLTNAEKTFVTDIPASGSYGDFFSNAPKIFSLNISENSVFPYVERWSLDGGFLNFWLKDEVFYNFLSNFEIIEEEPKTETELLLNAYIQLAENEKKYSDEYFNQMQLSVDVKRCLVCLMKYQYLNLNKMKNADFLLKEIISSLEKIKADTENLKSFVIIYEPLLIAARGSLTN